SLNYSITGDAPTSLAVTLFTSNDGVTPDDPLQAVTIEEAGLLSAGAHTLTLPPDFADLSADYQIIAVLDPGYALSETNENNNQQLFAGGVFQTADGIVHVHGTSGADTVSLAQASQFTVQLNGGSVISFPTSGTGAATAFHVRTHGGADSVRAAA